MMTARERAHEMLRACGWRCYAYDEKTHNATCDMVAAEADAWRAGRDAAARVCSDYAFSMADDLSCPRIAVAAAHTCVDHIQLLKVPTHG